MAISSSAGENISAWENGEWDSLPSLQGEIDADVCVIGLGGSGLTAIDHLVDPVANRKMTVIGLDAAAVAGGAAGRNAGFLLAGTARFYHDTVASVGPQRAARLYAHTIAEIDRICAAAPQAVRRGGSLRIATSAQEWSDCERQYSAMQLAGLPVEHYSGVEGRGLLLPTDGSFDPLLRCRLIAQRLRRQGIALFEHSPVIALEPGSVRTPRGRIRCAEIIVAVDGRLETLLPELAGKVRTARLQMLSTAPLTQERFTRPVYARFGYDYWQQTADRRLVLGGFRDAESEAEWTSSTEVSAAIQERLDAFLRDVLAIDAPITHRWAASAGFTAGAMPILAEIRPRLWAIGGYNGTGNVVGALCARAVADLISTGQSDWADLVTAAAC